MSAAKTGKKPAKRAAKAGKSTRNSRRSPQKRAGNTAAKPSKPAAKRPKYRFPFSAIEFPRVHSAWEYCVDVVMGREPANEWIEYEAGRFVSDLKRTKWTWEFDPIEAEKPSLFLEHLTIPAGPGSEDLGNSLFELLPWQCWSNAQIFGWRQVGNPHTRRFSEVSEIMGRKNGKSTRLAALTGYELLQGPGHNGQLYSVATTQDQASVVYKALAQIVGLSNPHIFRDLKVLTGEMTNLKRGHSFMPLQSRNTDALWGKNSRWCIFDECAKIKKAEAFSALRTSAHDIYGQQIYITTGYADCLSNPFMEILERNKNRMRGRKGYENERAFTLFYAIPESKEEDWANFENLKYANPNFRKAPTPNVLTLQSEHKLALDSAGKDRIDYQTLSLSMFITGTDAWIDSDTWENCVVEPEEMQTYGDVFIGADYGGAEDFCSVVCIWRNDKGIFVKHHAFCIAEMLGKRRQETQVFLQSCRERGEFTVVDEYRHVVDEVADWVRIQLDKCGPDGEESTLVDVGFDPSAKLFAYESLQDLKVDPFSIRRGPLQFGPVIDDCQGAVIDGTLAIERNDLLDFMISNTRTRRTAEGFSMFEKVNDQDRKNDGAIALTYAVGAMRANEIAPGINITAAQFVERDAATGLYLDLDGNWCDDRGRPLDEKGRHLDENGKVIKGGLPDCQYDENGKWIDPFDWEA